MLLSRLAKDLSLEFNGDDIEITSINTLVDAKQGELSFLENPKYIKELEKTDASAVLVSRENLSSVPSSVVALVSKEPYLKLAESTRFFAPNPIDIDGKNPIVGEGCYIGDGVYVGKDTKLGNNVTVMPGAFVGNNVTIGDNTLIHPNVTIYRDCKIGKGCIIHAGTVIGSDGFGFAHTKLGEHVKIFQNGNVVIEDSVEIGANCTIDSAVFSSTVIKKGAKLDNLVHIAHNCEIGEYAILTGQVGVSGSTKLGRNVVMGGQSATVGHIEVAPFTTIAARGGVTKSIRESHKTFSGFPLMEHRVWLRLQGKIAKLLKQ